MLSKRTEGWCTAYTSYTPQYTTGYPQQRESPQAIWYGKTRMNEVPSNKGLRADQLSRLDTIHQCDRQTDRQDSHVAIACTASGSKNATTKSAKHSLPS